MKKLLIIILSFLSIYLSCSTEIAGGSDDTSTGIEVGLYGKLVLENGTPVEDALVQLYKSTDSIPFDSTLTNDTGLYLFDTIDQGTYNIKGIYIRNNDTLYATHHNIYHNLLTDAGTDTLRAPGYIKGHVDFNKDDKMGVSVFIPGTSYNALTDKDGKFLISGIPPDSFYIVAYKYIGYLTAIDSNVIVCPRDTTDLGIKKLEIDPNSPIPPPDSVYATFDSIKGVVTISWEKVQHPNFIGYRTYRKDSSQTAQDPVLLSGKILVTDTIYNDTIFYIDTAVHLDSLFQNAIDSIVTLQYQICSQDKNYNISKYSKPCFLKVFRPDLPSNPSPYNGETAVDYSLQFSWSPIKKAMNDTVTYIVLCDSTYPPTAVLQNLTDTITSKVDLKANTLYYWCVKASYGSIETVSPTWQFKTVNQGGIKWAFKIEDRLVDIGIPAIAEDNIIYITTVFYNSDICKLYAISPKGLKKWELEFSFYAVGRCPVVNSNGIILLGTSDSTLCAINSSGTTIWTFKSRGSMRPWLCYPAICSDNTIYIASRDVIKKQITLNAINSDGLKQWGVDLEGRSPTSATIGRDGTIYTGTLSYDSANDCSLHAINPDGTLKWEFILRNSFGFTDPVIGFNGTIYVFSTDHPSPDNFLYAINPDGSLKFKIQPDNRNPLVTTLVIGSEETLYFPFASPKGHGLCAFDANGTFKWEYFTKDELRSSPAIGLDGTIFCHSEDGIIHIINPDGSKKKEIYTGYSGAYSSYPIIGNDGTVYVVGNDSSGIAHLIAVKSECGGVADSPWPMYRHDGKHTGRSN